MPKTMPLAGALTHPETGTREPTRSASDSPELPLDFSVQMANALFFKAPHGERLANRSLRGSDGSLSPSGVCPVRSLHREHRAAAGAMIRDSFRLWDCSPLSLSAAH